jgi:uncharacterized protein with HEPN domain
MQRDRVYLLDILEAARLALEYVSEKTRAAFLEDVLCQDAVIRRIEIIGEAPHPADPQYEQTGSAHLGSHSL